MPVGREETLLSRLKPGPRWKQASEKLSDAAALAGVSEGRGEDYDWPSFSLRERPAILEFDQTHTRREKGKSAEGTGVGGS